MKVAAHSVILALVGTVSAHAKPPAAHSASKPSAPAPHVFVRPAPPLPMLASVARVRVEAGRDHVVVTEEVSLPRGEWESGGLDLYVAFGAPGTPVAVDARLVPVPRGATESRLEDTGDALLVEPAVHHSPSSQLLLGRPQMAGTSSSTSKTPICDGRIRMGTQRRCAFATCSSLPAADNQGGRDVVVRLGIHGALPLTVGRVQVVSLDGQTSITRAQAALCGPEAEPHPLSVSILPKPSGPLGGAPAIPPSMAVRHASDDLCVRWWAAP